MFIIPNCEFHGCWSLDNASSKVIIPMTMTSLYRNISVSAADGIIIIILIWCIDLIHSMYWFNTYGYLSVATRRYIIVIIIIYWEGCKWELMLQYIKVTAFILSLKYICWFKEWWNLYSKTGSFKLKKASSFVYNIFSHRTSNYHPLPCPLIHHPWQREL